MKTQLDLFGEPVRQPKPDIFDQRVFIPKKPRVVPLTVVLSWDAEADMVLAEWSDLEIHARFQDWHAALACVLHPSNLPVVTVRVR